MEELFGKFKILADKKKCVYDDDIDSLVEQSVSGVKEVYSVDYVNVTSKVNMTKVELYNTLGQVVYTSNVNANTVNVPVSSLNNGTYFVKAYANNMVVTKKIVIE